MVINNKPFAKYYEGASTSRNPTRYQTNGGTDVTNPFLDEYARQKQISSEQANVIFQKMAKYIPQQLQAQGYGGLGATESTMLKANSEYAQNLANIEQQYRQNVSNYNDNRSAAIANALANYKGTGTTQQEASSQATQTEKTKEQLAKELGFTNIDNGFWSKENFENGTQLQSVKSQVENFAPNQLEYIDGIWYYCDDNGNIHAFQDSSNMTKAQLQAKKSKLEEIFGIDSSKQLLSLF